MWKNEILIWEDTPSSVWNKFGKITTEEFNYDNDLYAKGITIWRKTTLEDFINDSIEFLESGQDFLEDRNIVTGVMLTISVINFIPLHFEIIKDDDVANKFLSLIKRDKDKYYFLKKDFQETDFSKVKALNILIEKLLENNILEETNDRFYMNGKILNSIHLWDSTEEI